MKYRDFDLNKNDNFTSEITIFISLSLCFASFRCRRHRKSSSLKRKKIDVIWLRVRFNLDQI